MKKVVMEKYEAQDDWDPREVRGTYGRGIKKGMMKQIPIFKRGIRYEVGNGPTLRFWEDL